MSVATSYGLRHFDLILRHQNDFSFTLPSTPPDSKPLPGTVLCVATLASPHYAPQFVPQLFLKTEQAGSHFLCPTFLFTYPQPSLLLPTCLVLKNIMISSLNTSVPSFKTIQMATGRLSRKSEGSLLKHSHCPIFLR